MTYGGAGEFLEKKLVAGAVLGQKVTFFTTYGGGRWAPGKKLAAGAFFCQKLTCLSPRMTKSDVFDEKVTFVDEKVTFFKPLEKS